MMCKYPCRALANSLIEGRGSTSHSYRLNKLQINWLFIKSVICGFIIYETYNLANSVVIFMKLRDSFHIYASLTILFWSLAYVLTRLALKHFSVFSLGFLRYFAASCALIVMVLILKIKVPKKADMKWFLAAGFFGFFLYMIAFNEGCKTTTAATSSVIIATVPVITALLARVFFQEKLGFFKWAATVIEFLGVVMLTLMNHAFSINPRLICLFFASVSLGVYNLLQRKLTETYSGLQASSYSIFAGTAMLAV